MLEMMMMRMQKYPFESTRQVTSLYSSLTTRTSPLATQLLPLSRLSRDVDAHELVFSSSHPGQAIAECRCDPGAAGSSRNGDKATGRPLGRIVLPTRTLAEKVLGRGIRVGHSVRAGSYFS